MSMNREDRLNVFRQLMQLQTNQKAIYEAIIRADKHTFFGGIRFVLVWAWQKVKATWHNITSRKEVITPIETREVSK